jgi:DNA-binding response OmpR family regulator
MQMVPTVLIVDDESSFVTSLALALGREGYRVLSAGDGASGLAIWLRERPDVVLLDLMLPRMHGLDVCRAIRAADGPQPGVIMVTAKDSDIEAVVGLESGADDYVAKPFNLSLLLARVRALLRRSRRQEPNDPPGATADPDRAGLEPDAGPPAAAAVRYIQLDRLRIDPAAYEAAWDGHQLDLSPRLFGLLRYLAANAGRVISRDELLNEVWGYEYAGQTRTVDVHVHWLREALSAAGAADLILTVRGVGYKLAAHGGEGRQ